MTTQAGPTYQLEGRFLEVCSCQVLCPCWVGADPDDGACDGIVAWHIDHGTIQGVEVSGLTVALSVHIPGNLLKGHWRALVSLDERATPAQHDALRAVFTGQLGGPLAELTSLIGEVVGVEQVPITFQVEQGKGTLLIGQAVQAAVVPLTGPTGNPTKLHESVFPTISGEPAYVGKTEHFGSHIPALGHDVSVQGHSAIQSTFRYLA